MILDEFVEVRWNISNKKHFIDKGYVFTKMKDSFLVNVKDLKRCSNSVVNVKCKICGIEKNIFYNVYYINFNNYGYYSCNKCSYEKRKITCIKKFGCENPSQNEEIREKRKITCIKKYGCENPSQNETIKKKKIETSLKNYGVECYTQTDEYKEKSRKTNLKKYGVEMPAQNKDIMEKTLNTIIKRYGEIWINHVPKYNANSIIYLDMISEMIGLPIQHALNGGEKKFVRYWVDGYIEKYNICIEWDENRHNSKNQKEHDLKRDIFLNEKFGCNIIRIKENEFLNNVVDEGFNVIIKINEIINSHL